MARASGTAHKSRAPDRARSLFAAAGEVLLDARDGVELTRAQVRIRYLNRERLFQRRYHLGQRERIQKAGFEQRLVGLGGDVLLCHRAKQFISRTTLMT